MRSLIKLGLILLVAVLGYNYFFGTTEEKEQSREIIGKVRDVGRDAWGLLKSEKEKLNEGKYDGAVEKVEGTVESIGDLLGSLQKTAQDLDDAGALDRLGELQDKQQALKEQLADETPESYDATEQEKVKSEIEILLKQTESLMKSMEDQ